MKLYLILCEKKNRAGLTAKMLKTELLISPSLIPTIGEDYSGNVIRVIKG